MKKGHCQTSSHGQRFQNSQWGSGTEETGDTSVPVFRRNVTTLFCKVIVRAWTSGYIWWFLSWMLSTSVLQNKSDIKIPVEYCKTIVYYLRYQIMINITIIHPSIKKLRLYVKKNPRNIKKNGKRKSHIVIELIFLM